MRRSLASDGEERAADLETNKGAWWMPRLPEAKKDVISCEKPR